MSLEKGKFPELPDKLFLTKFAQFQSKLTEIFDKLERKEAILIEHIYCYIKLAEVIKTEFVQKLLCETLKCIMNRMKIF